MEEESIHSKEHGEERIEDLQSMEKYPRDVRMRRRGAGRRAGQYAAGWSIHCLPEEGEGNRGSR